MRKLFTLCSLLCAACSFAQTGRVGIGTTAPQAQLHATGSVQFDTLKGNGLRPVYVNENGQLVSHFSSSTTPYNVPDNNCTGISSTIVVRDMNTPIASANIKVLLNAYHPENDLRYFLISPSGSILSLYSHPTTGYATLFSNTVFSDAGSVNASSTYQFTSRTVKPSGDPNTYCGIAPNAYSFAGMGGGSIIPNGTWTLRVIDDIATDTGSLYSWAISFDGSVPALNTVTKNFVAIGSNNGALQNGIIYQDSIGNIGIGTTPPAVRLDVAGDLGVKSAKCTYLNCSGSIYANYINSATIRATNLYGDGSLLDGVVDSRYNQTIDGIKTFNNNLVGRSNLFVSGNLSVGSTASNSKAKVEIYGGINATAYSYAYLSASGTGMNPGSGGVQPYALYASERIWCGTEINVTSDKRTKTNIQPATGSLDLVNRLRVVDYNYIDRVSKGNQRVKGFLAQEVEQVMPDAVIKNTGIVPNIYRRADRLSWDSAIQQLTIELNEPHQLLKGDKVKLIADSLEQTAAVVAVNGNAFTVAQWAVRPATVFVYGKEVQDLRNLDYNKLFSAGIGAIQELSKEVNNLKKQMEEKERRIAGLEKLQASYNTLAEQVKQLQQALGIKSVAGQ